ncbi:MAG: hypothetical protein ACD_52C00047G0001, partial [uncultured bacterium]
MSEREKLNDSDLAYFEKPEWAAIDRQEFLSFARGFVLPLVFESLEVLSAAWYGLSQAQREDLRERPAYDEWAQVVNEIFQLKNKWLGQVAAILGVIPTDPYGIWERPGDLRLAKPYLRTDLINEETLVNLASLVRQVVSPEHWFPRFESPSVDGSPRLPFFVVLPATGHLLPRQWQLGAKTYQLQMGRVLVPHPQICSEQEVATIFDVIAENYDDPTFADWEYKRLVFTNMFLSTLDNEDRGGRILDVGSGTGGFYQFLHQFCAQYEYEYCGHDLSGQMLRKAKGHFG